MKVILNVDTCTGHGRCYTLAPALFDCDEQGHSVLLVDDVDGDLLAQARVAVTNCPEGAISIVEG
ncbi:MAG: ferredoxin [Actinomycetota bacterium]|nr:ferredoxin [Actinomycetota bacterium]